MHLPFGLLQDINGAGNHGYNSNVLNMVEFGSPLDQSPLFPTPTAYLELLCQIFHFLIWQVGREQEKPAPDQDLFTPPRQSSPDISLYLNEWDICLFLQP